MYQILSITLSDRVYFLNSSFYFFNSKNANLKEYISKNDTLFLVSLTASFYAFYI